MSKQALITKARQAGGLVCAVKGAVSSMRAGGLESARAPRSFPVEYVAVGAFVRRVGVGEVLGLLKYPSL